ncbi:MAG: di-trans,poly-cis-decaprenylcistransferase [Puniceicoccales bacterium]|jgi:undecaprenyl diphosphate synthase|nr:di-trans,poly-cis-decaprenylcistransferase [Puniceicoccales bacterium]
MFSGKPVPRHIGIILDGNGRWAQQWGKSRLYGHRQGAKNVQRIVRHAQSLGIPFLTLYTFSIENNARPKAEISGLMSLFERYAKHFAHTEHDQGIRIRLIGNIDAMKKSTAHALRQLEIKTQDRKGMVLILAVNYGGRDEILRALHRFQESGKAISPACWEDFEIYLDTHGIPDPDLIIRTSGEMRLSHFLPLQSVYSELYFPPVLWPDFSEKDLEEAIEVYRKRQRRFGEYKKELSR